MGFNLNKRTTIIILFLLIILSLYVNGDNVTLIQKETFENYSTTSPNSTLFFNESNGAWNCTDLSDYPDCSQAVVGADNDDTSTYYQIIREDGNTYLRLNSYTQDNDDYRWVDLTYNFSNFSTTQNLTLMYDARYTLTNPFGSTYWGNSLYYSMAYTSLIANTHFIGISGNVNAITESSYMSIRDKFNGLLVNATPHTSDCDVSDGNWHNIRLFFEKNATNNYQEYQNTTVFIDGVQCSEHKINLAFGDSMHYGYLLLRAMGDHQMDIDNIQIFEGFHEFSNIYNTLVRCPYDNCLFYDDFAYEDYYNLSNVSYTGQPDSGVILDEKLYINSSWNKYPKLSNELYSDYTNYEIIDNLVRFDINDTTTPSGIESQPIIYQVLSECEYSDLAVGGFRIYFSRDDDYTGSENKTAVDIYYLKSLGEFTYGFSRIIDNGDYFYIKQRFDTDSQTSELSLNDEDSIDMGIGFSQPMTAEFYNPCPNNIGSFEISRSDANNDINLEFISIGEITYFGITPDSEIDSVFQYTNETNQSTALVDTEIGEELTNALFTLGFKTKWSKFFGFMVLMIFVMLVMWSSGTASSVAKSVGTAVVAISFLTVGYFWGLVPLEILIILFFVMAVIGGLVYYRLVSNVE